jgi:hypothetical protein
LRTKLPSMVANQAARPMDEGKLNARENDRIEIHRYAPSRDARRRRTSSYFGQVVGLRYCSFFATAAAISVSKHGADSCETCAFMQALIRP